MDHALKQAEIALNNDEVPVGAVLVRDKQIIAAAANTMNHEKNPLRHAEMNVIEEGLIFLQKESIKNDPKCLKKPQKYLDNCHVYVTLEPCPMCITALLMARVSRIYFGAFSGENFQEYSIKNNFIKKLSKNCEIYGGIMEYFSKNLLEKFFEKKR